jgi:hypothetical protein
VTDPAFRIREFTNDLLVHAGALVASDGAGLDVMVDTALSARLGLAEFERLVFRPDEVGSSGALIVDYDSQLFDKLGGLVDALGRVAFVKVPAVTLQSIDPVAELSRALTLQNGVVRAADVVPAEAVYFWFVFEYDLLADERAGGLAHVWVNPATRSVSRMGSGIDPSDLADAAPFALDGALELPWGLAEAAVTAALAPTVDAFLDGLRRRRDRDLRRLREYYVEIDQEIRRKLERTVSGTDAWRRETERRDATARSYRTRLTDVTDRYSVRVLLRPVHVLACRLPTQRVTARLMRRNKALDAAFSWNPVDRRIDSRCCDGCRRPVSKAYLCDDQVHILCEACLGRCSKCGKVYCRACYEWCPRRHET